MLLERRDAERKIPAIPGLDRTEKTLLLADLAYWLLRNGYIDAEQARVVEQLARTLRGMKQIGSDARTVYRHLLERSGLLREPVDGRVDFVHRTFQEYLAARAAIWDADDIGALIEHAHRDDWHEVIVMAAGHASRGRRAELINRLLDRGDQAPKYRDNLHLLALACLETAPELDPDLRRRIEESAANLLPPKSVNVASSFAAAGPFVLELLADTVPSNARETAGTIRAAAETGLPDALSVIARFRGDTRPSVQSELLEAWGRFDADEYARIVLADLPIKSIETDNARYTASLGHLKNVISVKCRVPDNGNLSTIPSQVTSLRLIGETPKLESLRTADLIELAIDIDSRKTIRINALNKLPKLVSFSMRNGQARGCGILSELSHLREVNLTNAVGRDELVRIGPSPSIKSLYLEAASDLYDLDPLGFLTEPQEVRLVRCDRLALAGIERWAHSLRYLSLRECNVTDLTPISSLRLLTELDLKGTIVTDATPLSRLPNLECLTIDSLRSARDLHQLREMRCLRKLKIGMGGMVDLGALAGMKDLTILIQLSTPVRGEHLLDPSVMVQRVDNM